MSRTRTRVAVAALPTVAVLVAALQGCLEVPPMPQTKGDAVVYGGDAVGGATSGANPNGGRQTGAASDGGEVAETSGDAGPPADVPMAPPPDLSALAGYWYVDGFGPRLDGTIGAYSAGTRVERHRASLLTSEGELVTSEMSLVPAPDLHGTWLLTHPETGVVYRGAFAPTSGFAMFVPEDRSGAAPASIIMMARANEDVPAVPADALVYTRIGRHAARGDGEVGTLRKTRDDAYMQEARYPAPPLNILPDRELGFWNIDPWRYSLYDAATGAEIEVVPTANGMGAIGVERTPAEGSVALLLGWTLAAPGGLPRDGDLFCGGLTWDTMDGMQPHALPATLSGDGMLQWAGGLSQRLTDVNGLYQLDGGFNPFGLDGAVAIGDADDELLIVLPFDPGPDNVQGVWGMMACVRTDLVPFPL